MAIQSINPATGEVLETLEPTSPPQIQNILAGAGEVLYRERLPQHLAIPKLWQRKALASTLP